MIKEYIKNTINFICQGDSRFYYEYEKELFRRLIYFINEEILSSDNLEQETLLAMINASNKTITNVGLNAETVNAHLRQSIRQEGERLQQSGDLPFSIKILQDERESSMDPVGTAFFMELVGKQAQHISGSLKSEFGKDIEKIYLSMIFESLGITETSKSTVEALDVSSSSFLESGLYYVRGASFRVVNNQMKFHRRGKQVDAMVYLYDQPRLSYLLAMEFSLSGRGNPTFQRNKANDMHVKFGGHVGLAYTAFDLGTDMRSRIEEDVVTIFFRDDTGTAPLLKIHNILREVLEEEGYDPSTYLPNRTDAEEKFRDLARALEKP